MSKYDKYLRAVRQRGISKAKIVNASSIVVRNWVRLKCQYGCGGYGKCLTCPPYSPTPEYTKKVLREYSKALLMLMERISPVREDKVSSRFKKTVVEMERAVFLDGYHKAYALLSGPCHLCRMCDTTRPCKHPHVARPSMEASGIDVYQTVRNNALKLEVVKTRRSHCTYVSLLLIT